VFLLLYFWFLHYECCILTIDAFGNPPSRWSMSWWCHDAQPHLIKDLCAPLYFAQSPRREGSISSSSSSTGSKRQPDNVCAGTGRSMNETNGTDQNKTTVQIHAHTHKHARPVCPCTSLADFSRGVTALEAPLEENQRRAGNFCRALLAGSIHDVRRRASTKIQGVKTDGEVTSELLNLWSPQPSHPLHKHGGLLRFRQYCCVVNKIFAPYVRLCFSALNSVGPWDLGWETRWARVCEKREGGEERVESKSVWQPSRIGTPHGSWGELIRRPTFEVWIADSVTNYRRPNTWVRGR